MIASEGSLQPQKTGQELTRCVKGGQRSRKKDEISSLSQNIPRAGAGITMACTSLNWV